MTIPGIFYIATGCAFSFEEGEGELILFVSLIALEDEFI